MTLKSCNPQNQRGAITAYTYVKQTTKFMDRHYAIISFKEEKKNNSIL